MNAPSFPKFQTKARGSAGPSTLALDAIVRQQFDLSWGKARAWIETGKVTVDGVVRRDPRIFPRTGAAVELHMNAPRSGDQAPAFKLAREQVLFADTQLIVVNKPSGISTVPFEGAEGSARCSKGAPLLRYTLGRGQSPPRRWSPRGRTSLG